MKVRFRMEDGIIEIGTPFADKIGFTKEKFFGYLWKNGELILISFIESRQPNQGNFSKLLTAIWNMGYAIGVPTPLGQMLPILKKKGFQPYRDDDCIVWIKENKS